MIQAAKNAPGALRAICITSGCGYMGPVSNTTEGAKAAWNKDQRAIRTLRGFGEGKTYRTDNVCGGCNTVEYVRYDTLNGMVDEIRHPNHTALCGCLSRHYYFPDANDVIPDSWVLLDPIELKGSLPNSKGGNVPLGVTRIMKELQTVPAPKPDIITFCKSELEGAEEAWKKATTSYEEDYNKGAMDALEKVVDFLEGN